MDIFVEIIKRIITQQEAILGPAAWEEASKVSGLIIDLRNKTVQLKENIDGNETIDHLIVQYASLFGPASREICLRAFIRAFVINFSEIDIQKILSTYGVLAQLTRGAVFERLKVTDLVIFELSETNDDVYAILSQAIVLKKPILCLYSKNNLPRTILNYLATPHIAKAVSIKSYTPNTIENILHTFLRATKFSNEPEELPSIKFTLRLTPKLDRYLTKLAEKRHINKAEYIRDVLEKESDKEQG